MLQSVSPRLAAAGIVMLALVGCGPVGGAIAGNWPVSSDGFPPIGSMTSVTGTVTNLVNGCLMLDTGAGSAPLWVVWPAGATYVAVDEDTNRIRLADGTMVDVDDRVTISGQLISRSDLPDGATADSMWGSHAAFCLGSEEHAVEILRAETVSIS